MNPLRNPQDDLPLEARIDALYEELRNLVTRYAGKPGLRDALNPVREELRILHQIEAEGIIRRYDSHLQAKYNEAEQLIHVARRALKS